MGHSELFEILQSEAGRGAVHLRTYLGTYLAILYDGTSYQSTKVRARTSLREGTLHRALTHTTRNGLTRRWCCALADW